MTKREIVIDNAHLFGYNMVFHVESYGTPAVLTPFSTPCYSNHVMKRPKNPFETIRLFFEIHWVKVVVATVLLISIIWPILALMQIDSYQRTYLMALFAMTPIQSLIYAGFF